MTTFTGTGDPDTINAASGVLGDFTGGTLAALQDAIGDFISGLGGNDRITAGPGGDTLNGGDGNDTIYGGGTPSLTFDYLYGGDGNDLLSPNGTYAHVFGGIGNDTLRGSASFGELEGGVGADRIIGTGGFIAASLSYRGSAAGVNVNLTTNAVSGGDATGDAISGFVNLYGSGRNDTLTGAATASFIDGLAGNDRISGRAGDDSFRGGDGNDTLTGASGNDRLDGGLGADSLDGGDGTDTVSYASQSVAIRVTLGGAPGQGGAAGDVLISIENLEGSTGNDTISGRATAETLDGDFGDDRVNGFDGNDDIAGSYGNDTLTGGRGDDTLSAGAGSDSIDGGDGFDTLADTFGFYASFVDLTAGTWAQDTDTDRLSDIESIITGSGADSITGSVRDERIDGGSGNDTVRGGGGNDTIVAGTGIDRLAGDGGNDTLAFKFVFAEVTVNLALLSADGDDITGTEVTGFENVDGTGVFAKLVLSGNALANALTGGSTGDGLSGNSGNDTLAGGDGRDTLSGGAGADRFVLTDGSPFADADRIKDFAAADTIALTRSAFGALGPLVQTTELRFGTAAQDGNDHLIYHKATGRLWYDANANAAGGQVLIATFDAGPVVTASDFIMI